VWGFNQILMATTITTLAAVVAADLNRATVVATAV
jgi:hypothetical protein